MPEHSPGPWTIRIVDLGWNAFAHLIEAEKALPQHRVIAEVRGAETPEQEDANTLLIAAAPDLLAACELAYRWLAVDAHVNLRRAFDETGGDVVDILRDALTKTLGISEEECDPCEDVPTLIGRIRQQTVAE